MEKSELKRRIIALMLFDGFKEQKTTQSIYVHPQYGSITNYGIDNKIIMDNRYYHNDYETMMQVWHKLLEVDTNKTKMSTKDQIIFVKKKAQVVHALSWLQKADFFLELSNTIEWLQSITKN